MLLSELIRDVEVDEVSGSAEADVSSVSYDSRRVDTGGMFFALKGLDLDGARFIDDAVRKGACAVVHEEYDGPTAQGVTYVRVPDARGAMGLISSAFYGRPSRRLKVVGITGTNGKTTTAYLIKSAIEAAGYRAGLLGTIRYEVGDRVLPAPNTTPESADLQAHLREMLDAGAQYAVIEVSSHSVSLKRTSGCEFAVRVFTNFTQDHLDFHGDMESYFAAKLGFFTAPGGVCVVNADDPRAPEVAAAASGRVITYGILNKAGVSASGIELSPEGIVMTLETSAGRAGLSSPLVGRHNVYNILAAVTACLCLDMPLEGIIRGIGSLKGIPGRFERVDEGQEFRVFVDYAHTDDALGRALAAAREFTPGRLITVFGCGGDRDRGKRPKMGHVAARLSDLVVVTSDNPRSEDPLTIISEVEAGIAGQGAKTAGKDFFTVPDRGEAIAFAVGMAGKGDTVLIAGKGHEDYQIIGAVRSHFDDREAARTAIRGLVKSGNE